MKIVFIDKLPQTGGCSYEIIDGIVANFCSFCPF